MTEQEILDGNKLIAEFDGWEPMKTKSGNKSLNWINKKHNARWNNFSLGEMNYHSSWDWLMPVVAKIHTLNSTGIAMHYEIEKQYSVVVSWIKHYNQNK